MTSRENERSSSDLTWKSRAVLVIAMPHSHSSSIYPLFIQCNVLWQLGKYNCYVFKCKYTQQPCHFLAIMCNKSQLSASSVQERKHHSTRASLDQYSIAASNSPQNRCWWLCLRCAWWLQRTIVAGCVQVLYLVSR